MDALTVLTAIAGIVATGTLSKVGETVAEGLLTKANELLSRIKSQSPHLASDLENAAPQSIDYDRVYSEIQEIAASDPEMQKLLREMKEEVSRDSQVAEIVERELNRADRQMERVTENWKGINIKGGFNTIKIDAFSN